MYMICSSTPLRARHNRSLKEGTKLWDHIAKQPLAATVTLEIPDKQHPHQKRKAEVEVRYDQVEVRRPFTANEDSAEHVRLTAIEVREINSHAAKKRPVALEAADHLDS